MARAVLVGIAGSPGVGIGRALLVGGRSPDEAAPAAATGARERCDAAGETERLRIALEATATELAELASRTAVVAGEDVGSIFEAQALFARDPALITPAFDAVAAGVPAREAVIAAAAAQADRLAAVDDPYFRARAADIRDVGRRIVDQLDGRQGPRHRHDDGTRAVLIADDLAPSEVATLRRELVAGLAFAGGAPTGHAAIVARALGIPLVLGLGADVLGLAPGSIVAVDGSAGRLLVDPDESEVRDLTAVRVEAVPVATEVGRSLPIEVFANVGSVLEAEAAARAGADGIGVVRTELLFHGRSSPPTVGEQRAVYAGIRRAMAPRRVVFRTLDIGGDKPAPWRHGVPEPNPALGVRGVRLALREPAVFEAQVRALAEAAGGDALDLLLPMVSEGAEVVAARARIEAVIGGLEGPRPRVAIGVMIEVPSAAIMADALVPLVDFLSIGTNDLVQYTLAADRMNPALADLASPFQPAVLRLIAGVVEAARAHGRSVAVCGEAGGDPAMVPLLVGLGVDELSVAPASIAAVRAALAGLDLDRARALAAEALAATPVADVRKLVPGAAPGGQARATGAAGTGVSWTLR